MKHSDLGRFVLAAVLLCPTPRSVSAAEIANSIKSEDTAVLYSFLGTAIPVAAGVAVAARDTDSPTNEAGPWVIITGYVVGPSLGHFYAERPGRALLGIGLRSVAFCGLAAGVLWSWDNPNAAAAVLGVGSVLLGAGSAIVDIADAKKSARIHNAKAGRVQMDVGPALVRNSPGVRVGVVF